MKKLVIHCTTSKPGTDTWKIIEVPSDISEVSLHIMCTGLSEANANKQGIYSECHTNNCWDDCWNESAYDRGISYCATTYVPSIHDRLVK